MSRTHPKLAICIGAQKSGTSWLFRCLQEHPDIYCAPQKEVHYFDKQALDTLDQEVYSQYFQQNANEPIWFEATTGYLHVPGTAAKIAHLFPDCQLIVLLRDPVERSVSHYQHQYSKGRTMLNFTDAINADNSIIGNSCYQSQLAEYTAHFPAAQLLCLDYAEIKSNPEHILSKVYAFLQLDGHTPAGLRATYNSGKARSHPLFNLITKTYLRLSKRRTGRALIGIVRRIGITNEKIERLLSYGRNAKRALTDTELAHANELLKDDVHFYRTLFNHPPLQN